MSDYSPAPPTVPTTPKLTALDAVAGYRHSARYCHRNGALGAVQDLAALIGVPRPRGSHTPGARLLGAVSDALARSLGEAIDTLPADASHGDTARVILSWANKSGRWELLRAFAEHADRLALLALADEYGAGSVDLADLVEGWDDPRDILALDLVEVARVAVLHKLAPLPGVIAGAVLGAVHRDVETREDADTAPAVERPA